jgi:hypothetical protein
MDSAEKPIAQLVLRIGLIGAGVGWLGITERVLSSGLPIEHPLHLLILILSGLAAFGMSIGGAITPLPDRWRRLILPAYCLQMLCVVILWISSAGQTWVGIPLSALVQTDAALYSEFAAEVLMAGHNPYTWDFAATSILYQTGNEAGTPTLAGLPESPYAYPALSFLVTLPFRWVGLPGIFSAILLGYLAVFGLLYKCTSPLLRPVILIPMLIGYWINPITFNLIGVTDIIWVALLIGMISSWGNPVARIGWFGLAVSFKQTPWLIAPFLFILLWKQEGGRRASLFLLGSGLVFIGINAPFAFADPLHWLGGVLTPLQAPLIYYGQGALTNLVQYGVAPLPKSFFLALSLSILLFLLFVYWRHFPVIGAAVWVLPAIYMWFSYRALITYWSYWIYPALASLSLFTSATPQPTRASWRITGGIFVCGAIAFTSVGWILGNRPFSVEMSLVPPLWLQANGRLTRLQIEVTNRHTGHAITPRFAFQHPQSSGNPLPLVIESGPSQLQSGQTGRYTVIARSLADTVYVAEYSQVVLTDAGGDYDARAVLTIPPDLSFNWPELIPNPRFLYWSDPRAPVYWQLKGDGDAQLVRVKGREALSLTVRPTPQIGATGSQVELGVTTALPYRPIEIEVSTDSANRGGLYGVIVQSGTQAQWFVFRPESTPTLMPTFPATALITPLQPIRQEGIWHIYRLDPALIQIKPPSLEPVYRGLENTLSVVSLKLFVISLDQTVQTVLWGGVEQPELPPPPTALMADVLKDPPTYYLRLGEIYLNQRNYQRAIESFELGLSYDPRNLELDRRLKRTRNLQAQLDPTR